MQKAAAFHFIVGDIASLRHRQRTLRRFLSLLA
jgi:hypothetical protein